MYKRKDPVADPCNAYFIMIVHLTSLFYRPEYRRRANMEERLSYQFSARTGRA